MTVKSIHVALYIIDKGTYEKVYALYRTEWKKIILNVISGSIYKIYFSLLRSLIWLVWQEGGMD